MGRRPADPPGARPGPGLRPHLPDEAVRPGAGVRPRVERPGRDDVLLLPPGRPRRHLRLDAPRRRRLPAAPGPVQGLRLGLYPSYDIFRAKADGSGLVRLTDTPGYDAEGTVCGKDGSIVFTSVRDGDVDLYRMDSDGKNVRRLTDTPGYDGGAFFNADCTKLVWRASRPKGKDLEEFRALLAQGLVRPTKLELYVVTPTAPTRGRSPTSTRRRSRRTGIPRRSASSSARTSPRRARASSTCGPSTSPGRASSG